jgi:hypothetical protein
MARARSIKFLFFIVAILKVIQGETAGFCDRPDARVLGYSAGATGGRAPQSGCTDRDAIIASSIGHN